MTAALEGGEWLAARPGRTLPPGKKRYSLYSTGSWVGPSVGLDGRKISSLPVFFLTHTPLLAFMTYISLFWCKCTQDIYITMLAQIKPFICTPNNSSHLPIFYTCLNLHSQIYEHRHCFLCRTIYSVMCIFLRWFPTFFFPRLNKLFLAEFTPGEVFRIPFLFKRVPIVQYPVWWHNLTLVCCSTWWFWKLLRLVTLFLEQFLLIVLQQLFRHPYAPHAQPISFFSILSPASIMPRL